MTYDARLLDKSDTSVKTRNVLVDHRAQAGIGSLRLEMETSTWLSGVLVATHGDIVICTSSADKKVRLMLTCKVDLLKVRRVWCGGVDRSLARQIAVGRGDTMEINLVGSKVGGGANRVIIGLDTKSSSGFCVGSYGHGALLIMLLPDSVIVVVVVTV